MMPGRPGFISACAALVAATAICVPQALAQTSSRSDTIHVDAPTGETDSDRANVQAAFDAVPPGGTIQFAPGTYLLGAGARLTVNDVTVLGHPEGTVLRGCDPEAFAPDASEFWQIAFECTGLYVEAEHQTIRGLTFEYTWHGIVVGPFPASAEEVAALEEGGEPLPAYPAGGQRIEGNTFRATPNGLRVRGIGNELSVVRDNDFIDVFHAIGIYGAPLHFLDNRVTVTEPGSVPFAGHTASAIIVSPGQTDCAGHVVAGNLIEGYPDPIYVVVGRGETCRGVEIRDNTIHASRVRLPEAGVYFEPTEEDSTLVGAPITLMNTTEPIPGVPESDTEGVLEDLLVEGNRIVGAEGLGILVQGVSRSRIEGNAMSGIKRRDPFPGITWDGFEQRWESANGSAIWLSSGSDGNEVVGNKFEDIAASAVVVEGDSNRVALDDPADAVRDLGQGNRVSGPGGSASPAAPPLNESEFLAANGIRTLESGRLIFHQLLHPVGEETYTLTREGSGYLLRADLSHNDRGDTTHRSVALRVGPELEPLGFRFTETGDQGATETVVDVNGGMAALTDPSDTRDVPVADGFFTTSAFAPHAVQMMLVRYWLRAGRPDSIPILPNGHARVQFLGRDTLEIADDARVLDRYHVRGVRWGGQTLWLDEDDQLVAAISFDFNYQAVREGYEEAITFFSDRARPHVLARAEERDHSHPPAHSGTFALVGATVIDGTGAAPLEDAAVLVRDGRIAAVGPRTSVAIPANVAVVDVAGRTVLPGLWDMHAHLAGLPAFGPIYLAAGVTTVRDVGNETEWGLALRDAFRSGRIAGPHVLLAAEIDGKVPESVGAIQADTPEEARRLVRHFHGLGFDQIKLYSSLSPDLVPVITGEAHRLGMTVTGHVPAGMTAIDAVRAGMDQINHFGGALREPMLPDSILASGDFTRILATFLALDSGSAEVRRMIDVLLQHGTVLDPTLAAAELRSRPASVPLRDIHPGAAGMPPEVAATIEAWFPGIAGDGAGDLGTIFRKSVELVGELHRAGVPVVAGTDVTVPGHGLHRELELYVEAGMTPLEAIQAATIVPARVMGLEQEAGTIEAGKRADLMVIDGDPLRSIHEIRNVHAVVADGRLYDAAALWRSAGFEPVPQRADTTAAPEARTAMTRRILIAIP